MHVYNNKLSPVRENFASINTESPYVQNFKEFSEDMLSKGFNKDILSLNDRLSVKGKRKNFLTFSLQGNDDRKTPNEAFLGGASMTARASSKQNNVQEDLFASPKSN